MGLIQMDVGEGLFVVAMALPAPGWTVAAAAWASAFAFQGAEQTPHSEARCCRHYQYCYDGLCHIYYSIKLPNWKNAVETSHAKPMV